MRKNINYKDSENRIKRSKIIRWIILTPIIIGGIVAAIIIGMTFWSGVNSLVVDQPSISAGKEGVAFIQENAIQEEQLKMGSAQMFGDALYYINPKNKKLFMFDPNIQKSTQVSNEKINKFLINRGTIYFLKTNGDNYEISKIDKDTGSILETGAKIDDLDNMCVAVGGQIYYSSHKNGFSKIDTESFEITNLLDDYVYDFQKYGAVAFSEVSDGFGISLFATSEDGTKNSRLMDKSPDSLCVYNNNIYFLGKSALYRYSLENGEIKEICNTSAKDGLRLYNDRLFFRDNSRTRYNMYEIGTESIKDVSSNIDVESFFEFIGNTNGQLIFANIGFSSGVSKINLIKYDPDLNQIISEMKTEEAGNAEVILSNDFIIINNDIGIKIVTSEFEVLNTILY